MMDQSNGSLLLGFRAHIQRCFLSTAVALSYQQEQDRTIPPADIIREYVDDAIEAYGMQSLLGTRKRHDGEHSGEQMKRRTIK